MFNCVSYNLQYQLFEDLTEVEKLESIIIKPIPRISYVQQSEISFRTHGNINLELMEISRYTQKMYNLHTQKGTKHTQISINKRSTKNQNTHFYATIHYQ